MGFRAGVLSKQIKHEDEWGYGLEGVEVSAGIPTKPHDPPSATTRFIKIEAIYIPRCAFKRGHFVVCFFSVRFSIIGVDNPVYPYITPEPQALNFQEVPLRFQYLLRLDL